MRLGTRSQRLRDVSARKKEGKPRHHDVPVRDDPVHDGVLEGVVPYGAIVAVVLLRPVEDGFRQSHRGGGEADERGGRPGGDVRGVEVEDVQEGLDDVEERCRCASVI